MRKLIVANIVSLDGYYEGAGRDVLAVFGWRQAYPADESFDLTNTERLRAADTLLLGRSSFEGFRDYWPDVVNTSDDPVQREISRLNNAIDKVVISDTLTTDQIAPWNNTRIIKRSDAHREIAALKQQTGKDILMFGSRILWNDLLAAGLVDELHLVIAPIVLGAGTPLFVGPPPEPMKLIEALTWKGSGTILARYDVSGQ